VLVVLLILAGIGLHIVAGLKVSGRHFDPAYFGWACLAAAFFSAVLAKAF